jgi:phosphoenolpyruvate carboxylase
MNKRKRDNCSNCESHGNNPTGHVQQFCAYTGGPFAGRFKDAAAAARSARQSSKSSTATLDQGTITQLHASVEEVEAQMAGNYQTATAAASRNECSIANLKLTVERQQQQIQTLMGTVKRLSNAITGKRSVSGRVSKGGKGFSHQQDDWDY